MISTMLSLTEHGVHTRHLGLQIIVVFKLNHYIGVTVLDFYQCRKRKKKRECYI